MSSIPQNHSDEKALVDCIQRFFTNIILVNFLLDVMEWKKKAFHQFLYCVINSATFLLEEVCICSNVPTLLWKSFPRTFSIAFLILQKQTGSVSLFFLRQTLWTMTYGIWRMKKGKMPSLLMTAFLIAPAARKQNWVPKFLTIRICSSKRDSGCSP